MESLNLCQAETASHLHLEFANGIKENEGVCINFL